jgi:hypothetical protein
MNNQPYPPDQPTQANQVPGDQPVYGATNRSANVGGVYTESEHERFVDPTGNQVENREEVIENTIQSRANTRYWIATITYFILGVLEVILLLRFLFRLLGANQGSGFIVFLYGLSHVFVAPFNGIFTNPALGSNSVFDVSALIAMLVYALIAWGIVALGRMIFAPTVPGRQHVTTTRRARY